MKTIPKVPTTIYLNYDTNMELSKKWYPSLPRSKNIFKYVLVSEPPKLNPIKPEFKKTIKWFCDTFDTSMDVIFSPSSCYEIVAMRYSLLWYLREANNLLPQECEDIFGIDRTTFYHAMKTVANAIDTKDEYYLKYLNI